ncbi:hypothetical protein SAMN05216257_102495 [Meinhardsimonia xiamenensis]|jgi:hypothetical protein|uniref:Uncharacterized protein n=2 Tax=Meinhardsimonia xiamenensis TaxID=990712 RepID=A0A1G9BCL2_9RHOB|nr:hypothetical protein [Meinhardsimonia xiamenensis]PRX35030.1 hypothetical protein LV81_01624 [Meinhardsimonia xiamenensis]SDK37199.1 hypothetical protein SAMN05216257_102495 [Meinhardsimonia xiamenensis]
MWKAAPLATLLLALGLAAAGFFTVRTVAFWIYWSDPAHRDQRIEGWMTPGYVAHSWRVPREVVFDAIGLAPGPGGHRPIEEIAASQGRSTGELIAALEAGIAAWRAANPSAGDALRP